MTSSSPSPVNRGMSFASMSIVLAIVMIAAPLGYMRYAEYMNERTWDVMALHMDTVTRAAQHYIRDNYATLQNQVNGGASVTVSGQTLRDKGYLPTGFSLTNFNTQSYQVGIARAPQKTSQLEAFVLTTGGQPIEFKGLRYISQSLSGMGGYLYPDNIANGADGGWQMKLTAYGLSGQSGHLVDWLSADVLGGGNDESDRLYRFQVNGRPDLNRMHTDIDMGNNAVSNASTITASGDIKTSSGWIVTHDSKGWMNETHNGGFYMDDDNWVKSLNGKGIYTSGQLKGGTVRSDGRASVGEYLQLDGIANEGSGCSLNGLVSRTTDGALLFCQNSIWRGAGKSNGAYQQLGYHIGTFSGTNTGGSTLWVSALGGQSTKFGLSIDDGSCENTYSLVANVNNVNVTQSISNNPGWAKSTTINFAVPAGAHYTIVSNPLPERGCSPGAFSVLTYQ